MVPESHNHDRLRDVLLKRSSPAAPLVVMGNRMPPPRRH